MIIQKAIEEYLDSVKLSRSDNTARTYANALAFFAEILVDNQMDPAADSIDDLNENTIVWMASALKNLSPATERLYLTATTGFYEFLVAEELSSLNMHRIRLLIKQRARRPGQRLPQFPKNDIEKTVKYANNLTKKAWKDSNDRLIDLRDRAFIVTLADTGLRVHEICNLRRGDIDWFEGKAIIIGKGDKQAVVRFSSRSTQAIKEYLSARSKIDGSTGKPLTTLPVFARHDRGAGSKIKPISTTTGRKIVKRIVTEAISDEAAQTITPHSFRHYFVTTVLQGSGGNLKLAQELARHQNIAITQRYAHLSADELDKGYMDIFEND